MEILTNRILTPKEFRLKNPNAYLEDYLAYLEKMQTAAETALENAQLISMDDSVIKDIQNRVAEILKMTTLIEKYLGQIVLNSVDTLTLEELQSYFQEAIDEENKNDDSKRDELENERKEIEDRLKELEEQIANDLYLNGRVKKFYEKEDTGEFFSENADPHSYVESLLDSLVSEETFEINAAKLKEQLSLALETECKIQNIELSSDISEICTKIMSLFEMYRNILIHSPGAKNALAQRALSESGIRQYLPDSFDEKTATYLICDIMNLKKTDTTFYNELPASLQANLANGRLQGKTYDKLLRNYQAFKDGKDLPSDDLSQEEKDEQNKLQGRLAQVNFELANLSAKKQTHQEFLANEEKMRSVLRERILEMIGDQVSIKDIDSIVTDEKIKLENLKTKLSESKNLLLTKIADLKNAKAVLEDQHYQDFFAAVDFNNARRVYKYRGSNLTEETILPFLNEEKRRLEQFNIMIDFQNKLDSIGSIIKIKKRNVILRSTIFKEVIRELEEQHQNAEKEAFQCLNADDLLYVNAPQIKTTVNSGSIVVLPPEKPEKIPNSFSEMSGVKPVLWNMTIGIDESTKRKMLAANPQFDNWEDYYQCLMQKYTELVSKLFSFTKDKDGCYIFVSTAEERESLKRLQNIIIAILTSMYEERKALREKMEGPAASLDSTKVSTLEYFLGKGVNPSSENLAFYIEQTEAKIAELEMFLADNYTLCSDLGITVPQGITPTDVESKEYNDNLNDRIQSLNLDGVTNLEEADAYKGVVVELGEYKVPASRVRKYYSDHKKK